MSQKSNVNFGPILREMLVRMRGSQAALAELLDVTQPTISRWIKNRQEPEKANHERILHEAREMGVVNVPDDPGLYVPSVIGRVGTGGEIRFQSTDANMQHGAGMPPRGATEYMVAVVVESDGLGAQASDGALIYYDSRRLPPTGDLMGKLCVIGLKDGSVLIKRLAQGTRPGLFHLVGPNGNVQMDQAVEWAARVAWIELP